MLANVVGARSAVRRLPEPYGAQRQPLDPGRRVLRRWPALLILSPIALFAAMIGVLFLIGLFAGGEEGRSGQGSHGADGAAAALRGLSAGDCVHNDARWPEREPWKLDCASADADYQVAAKADCGPSDYLLRAEYLSAGAGESAYCVKPH
ncbi:hypothetical protein AB0C52_00420 [Streptomyces sp. NPDC048717]|uniref:LppU/SCO3897 family protein n=1 Tax=Streptomyces sp. NPDC048717 TaxID=3154928 RepID=UPI003427D4C5